MAHGRSVRVRKTSFQTSRGKLMLKHGKKKDEHAFLKQFEVVLGEAVKDIEGTKLQAAEDLTGMSHEHVGHAADVNHAKWLTSV